jgi:hypothetical protein
MEISGGWLDNDFSSELRRRPAIIKHDFGRLPSRKGME